MLQKKWLYWIPLVLFPFNVFVHTRKYAHDEISFEKYFRLFLKTKQNCNAFVPRYDLYFSTGALIAYLIDACLIAYNQSFFKQKTFTFGIIMSIPLIISDIIICKRVSDRGKQIQVDVQTRCANYIFKCEDLQKICQQALRGHFQNTKFQAIVRDIYHEQRWRLDLKFDLHFCFAFHDIQSQTMPKYMRDFYECVQICDRAFATINHISITQCLHKYVDKNCLDIIFEYLHDCNGNFRHVSKNPLVLFMNCFIQFQQSESIFIELMKQICD